MIVHTLGCFVKVDAAAGKGKTRAQVAALSDGETDLVAPIPQGGGTDPNRFTVAAFRVSADKKTCTCPNGQTTTRVYRQGNGDGLSFRFVAKQCTGCPLWAQCRKDDASPNGHRSVFISDYHSMLRQAHTFNASDEGKALLMAVAKSS
ncbi:MAG: hypothetical protein EI684_14140 [Candidatus Viridilinea halotolerans]|uniref:Transposase DDE domain-containing protein n=1 Tax=Candidatus Viridilinea halotolerans TaxID=2491704 RepID=A0A426TWM5_9CHLR|nr:MAG: hypothetical protein EI684_14140 [Candidatus Viridilinea halotolerans]